ncbi:MAG: ThiF family adenylyltransferase [Blastocatellia bacterium]
MQIERPGETSSKKIVVVGAGGNIGSHLVPHLARLPDVACITLIDKDVYERANLTSQHITQSDVGKRKASVQARLLRRINSQLRVEAIADAVERVPLGSLRADVILSCLDSRVARQRVNQFAWRLGVPMIDAGVDAGGLLARVNVYVPGTGGACLECAWDDRDYDALEQAYPCNEYGSKVAATNAPSSLGGLAAALQAIECQKLLSGQTERAAIGKQVLVDASYHKHYVTAFRRNPNCRFSAHEVWRIETLDQSSAETTLGEALRFADGNGEVELRVEGKPFVKRLRCPGCGTTRSLLYLECSLRASQSRCGKCGHRMMASGFDLFERLSAASLTPEVMSRSLGSLGLRPGEVFSVGTAWNECHYEIGEPGRC